MPEPEDYLVPRSKIGVAGGVASLDATTGRLSADQVPLSSFVNVVDLGADPTGVTDCTLLLREIVAGDYGPNIYFPGGVYAVGGEGMSFGGDRVLTVGPSVTTMIFAGATIRLADNAVRPSGWTHVIGTDPAVGNGELFIDGIQIDGNDAGQLDEAVDTAANPNNYNRSSGMVWSNGTKLVMRNVEVRHTRGHGINHWNWTELDLDGYHVMQMKNPVTPGGGRRRDGITGASQKVTIRNVTGYTADDLIALVAGANWGTGLGINIDTINIENVNPQVCDTDAEIKAWRGVVLYTQNGARIRSASIRGVVGETKQAHIYVRSEADNTGSITSLSIDGLVGASQSFTDGQTFFCLSHTRVDQLILTNVARRADPTSYGGSTTIPVSATVIVKDSAWIKTLILDDIVCEQNDTGTGRDADLIQVRDTARIDTLMASNLSLTEPYATTPGVLTLLRWSSSTASPCAISGIPAHRVVNTGATPLNIGVATGVNIDADLLVSTGTYVSSGVAANWPVPATGGNHQMMQVVRHSDGTVIQEVTRHRDDLNRKYTRVRSSAGVWTAWLVPAVQTQSAWDDGVAILETVLSPAKLAQTIKKLTGFRAGGIPGDNTDANILTAPGFYATATSNSPNWPAASQMQGMLVWPLASGPILQVVVRLGSTNQTILSTRSSSDAGATWTAWSQLNAFDLATFKDGIGTLGSLITPAILNGTINQGGTTAARPTGNARKQYMRYFDTTLGKPIVYDGTNWKDATGATV